MVQLRTLFEFCSGHVQPWSNLEPQLIFGFVQFRSGLVPPWSNFKPCFKIDFVQFHLGHVQPSSNLEPWLKFCFSTQTFLKTMVHCSSYICFPPQLVALQFLLQYIDVLLDYHPHLYRIHLHVGILQAKLKVLDS